jgi:hypothetical protein
MDQTRAAAAGVAGPRRDQGRPGAARWGMGAVMALTRVWTPTKYYSGGGSKRLLVIHTMEGFTGPNGAYDCAKYFQGNVGASSHVCIDNNRGKIWEGVARTNSAWTQCNYNSASVSCEQSGYASWSRDYWLSNRSNQLHNIADWIAEESAKLGIPIVKLSASQAQGSGRGICYHSDLGSAGCGHSDPGANWPLDKVLEWAKGTAPPEPTPPQPEGKKDMAPAVAYYKSKPYFAYVGTDNKLRVNGGMVDPSNNTKSGVSIAVDQDTGRIIVCYTNTSGKVCTYEQPPGDSKWYWSDRGMQSQ